MNIAILGAGSIAGTMAKTLREMPEVNRYAVAARDHSRASAFAEEYGFERAYGSYEEMAADPKVDLVYIATPHSHHEAHARLCLEQGKHVLCEKAFTANAAQAEEICAIAKEKGLLLAEAIWTRYMPVRRQLDELLAGGAIGEPHTLNANLGYLISGVPRLTDPALAGGALLDVGVYPINFALMAFGQNVQSVSSTAVLTDRGVDAQNSITLTYPDGKIAVLYSTMCALTDRKGMIAGDGGYLEVENINNPQGIRVYDTNYREKAYYPAPKQISGYEYEVRAAIRAIEQGITECPEMPHADTLYVMRLLDTLRAQWGVVYPFEC